MSDLANKLVSRILRMADERYTLGGPRDPQGDDLMELLHKLAHGTSPAEAITRHLVAARAHVERLRVLLEVPDHD